MICEIPIEGIVFKNTTYFGGDIYVFLVYLIITCMLCISISPLLTVEASAISVFRSPQTVTVDGNTNIFYSPMGLTQESVDDLRLRISTLEKAEGMDYKINANDKQNQYFYTEGFISKP